MAEVDRLKRQILRDLVQENVDLIEGNLTRRMRRRRQLRLGLRALAVVLVSFGLFGSTRLLSKPVKPAVAVPAATVASAAPVPATKPHAPPASDTETEAASFTAPTPVDAAVFPLAVRKIAIDPGHGGDSLGTQRPARAGGEGADARHRRSA